ncbi:MAG: hypothetical protein RR837_07105 [Bacteroidales bacterium]
MEKLKYATPTLEVIIIEAEDVIAASSSYGLEDMDNENPDFHSNDKQTYRTMWGR